MSRSRLLAPALALLASCGGRPDTGPVVVSAIGRDAGDRAATDATAQGLVRFDAAGQVEPGLAQRWIVTDGGTSYIFRLRRAQWADGAPVIAGQVARILRRRLAAPGPLRPFLTAVADVVEMTPEVLEVRLSRQRPNLLQLFAQPELSVARAGLVGGTGPMRAARGDMGLLTPAVDPDRDDPDDPRPARQEEQVRLRAERAALAVARFVDGRSDLVTGGTVADWPLVAASGVGSAAVRLDPAAGLFGLRVERRDGFLGDAGNRRALSAALDRAAITGAVAAGWEPADRVLADPLDGARPPVVPGWTLLTPEQRRAEARARVRAWTGGPVRLRVALPSGPGGTLLWGQVAASLLAVGVRPARVGPDAQAELRLIDAVAPYDSARWFLATACGRCGPEAEAALAAARDAPGMAARARALARADAALDADAAFMPLARPLRWSLVAARLTAWTPNARAAHPLNRLRAGAN